MKTMRLIHTICAIATISALAFAGYEKYRGERCEVVGCENSDVEAHHIYPQSQRPDLADGQGGTNIITLCRFHHVQWGHCGATGKWYNTNIVEMVRLYNTGRTEMKK